MTAEQRRRHARHLLLVEIGEAGQARLCATRVALARAADASCAEVARDYLARAGVRVAPDVVPELAVPTGAELDTLAGRPELRHAAAALAGAFVAVEAIKGAVKVGEAAVLPLGLSLSEASS